MTKALISNEILTWARQRAGLSIDALALAMKVDRAKLRQWEVGEEYPTFKQAQILANKLSLPLGYLFLEEPPQYEPQIPDLRTVGSELRNQFSLEFEEVLNDCIVKQNWYREEMQREGKKNLPFVGKYSMEDEERVIANDISEKIKLNSDFRKASSNENDFLTRLIDQIENIGILVLRNGVVKNNTTKKLQVTEFRGFVLSDPLAPLIFINNNDATSAKIFTLIHEIAHIWIGESGVSNIKLTGAGETRTKRIEKFCNATAAEVLVPTKDFKLYWNNQLELFENIEIVSKTFHVSRLVILIKALSLNKISQEQFDDVYTSLNVQKKKTGSGGNSLNTIPVRNSKRFTKVLLASTLVGNTLYREAARLLGLKNIATVQSLVTHLEMK